MEDVASLRVAFQETLMHPAAFHDTTAVAAYPLPPPLSPLFNFWASLPAGGFVPDETLVGLTSFRCASFATLALISCRAGPAGG